MNAERLKQIEEIFHKVLKLSPTERDIFFAEFCSEDEELRREVESLLSFENSSDGFLETPPQSLAAEMFAEKDRKNDIIGKQVRHYKIIELLGKGGMGEVYLAEDTKLRRKIALKLLSPEFSTDVERKKRFEKEAQAISALNHPNIITIYEIEDSEEINFIATEFIDGQTLGLRFSENRMNWQEAVRIAIQITGALESAHSVGIIHRDIKPANIMIRKDGIVKVLDFGLAKLTAPTSEDSITRELTAANRVMGTINYMSPEQALGERLDARTDIFSFGVVLYEMLSGKVPFGGVSDAAVYNATIHKTLPSVSESNAEIPAALDQIVKHALEKDRDVRYQTFYEFRGDLKKLLSNPNTNSFDYAVTDENVSPTESDKIVQTTRSSSEIVLKPSRSALWLIALLLIVGLAFGFYWKYFYVPPSSTTADNFQSIKLDVLTAHGLTQAVAISPDGKYIAYTKDLDGEQSLWLRQTSSVGDTQIVPPNKTKYDFLKFSTDGNFIYFVGAQGEDQPPSLFKITTLGRNQQKIVENVDSQISFSSDGKNIAFVRSADGNQSIIITDEQGKNERILKTRKYPEVYAEEISWSPDSKLIATPTLTRGATYAAGIAVIDVTTGDEKPIPLKAEKLLRISQVAWVNDGKGLIYRNYSADMGQRYQMRYASYPSGEVQNVTNDLSSYEDFSLTADGKTMVAVQREYSMGIWLTTKDNFTTTVSIDSKTGADDGERGVSWTKDGKIVYVSSEGGAQNIWRMDADGANPKPLTNDYEVGKILPTLSIGSGLITFFKVVTPGNSFFQMDSDGQNLRRVVKENDAAFAAASANEDWVVYTSSKDGKLRIWKVPLKGGDAVQLTNVESIAPAISRNGKLVAYFIREKGQPLKLGIISIEGGNPLKTFELPATTITAPGIAWNKNGDGILFVNTPGTTSNIWKQLLDGTKPKLITNFKEFQIAAFALNPEGNRLAIARGSRNRDVVLIKDLRY